MQEHLIDKFLHYFTCGYTRGSKVYYFIVNWWQNPYKNVRKVIPRYKWRDRDAVIQDVLFQIFLGYIDDEDKYWGMIDNEERRKDFKWLAEYLKVERPGLIEQINSDDETVVWFDALDKQEELDEKAGELIFKHRHTLWT